MKTCKHCGAITPSPAEMMVLRKLIKNSEGTGGISAQTIAIYLCLNDGTVKKRLNVLERAGLVYSREIINQRKMWKATRKGIDLAKNNP